MREVCLAAGSLSVLNLYVLGWVLALAAVMAIEKNLPWGRRLSPVLGVALLTWAGLIALEGPAA